MRCAISFDPLGFRTVGVQAVGSWFDYLLLGVRPRSWPVLGFMWQYLSLDLVHLEYSKSCLEDTQNVHRYMHFVEVRVLRFGVEVDLTPA